MAPSREMPVLDVLISGGTLVDGTGSAGRPADVGLRGDRIEAIGDLSAIDRANVGLAIDATDRTVAPGFIDPHGHSDASLFVDGALVSHLRQGFTTQLSGNCGDSLAPITDTGRELVELALRPHRVTAAWSDFHGYLDAVEQQSLGINLAFLVGHGTIRGAVLGGEAVAPNPPQLAAMVGHLEEALDAGALGLSSGLIYAPGIHAGADELVRLVEIVGQRGGLYATHMRNEAAGLFDALDEAIDTLRRATRDGAIPRLQVSHLKAGARAVWGRATAAVARLEAARGEGLDVSADQYPYTAAATTLQIVLPPALLALGIDETVAALSDMAVRERIRAEIEGGRTGWENVAADPGWDAITISTSATRPSWAGRSLGDLGRELGRDAADLAFDVLADDRLDTSIVIECMSEADVAELLAVPWISVCTDAEGRRPRHPILDAGIPHPRTYGTTARVLGRYVRDLGNLSTERAIAKLTSVPAARLGLVDRGVVREGAFGDLVVFDPATVAEVGSYDAPARHPVGIDHVIVNGEAAILDGRETGVRAGRLVRR